MEIKFRRYLHRNLVDDIRGIQEHWVPFVLVLAVAEPPHEWTGVVRHLRVFKINADTSLNSDLATKWPDTTIQQAQDVILRIASED